MVKFDLDKLEQYTGEGKAKLTVLNRIKNGKKYFYSYAAPELVTFLDKLDGAGIGNWDIGNISKDGGGSIRPYSKSHCIGQDVDIAIPLVGGDTSLKSDTIDLGAKDADNDAFLRIDPTGESKSTKESSEDDIEYGYSLNKINEDGTIENISSENANQAFYGASIQKPVIALVALIAGEELSDAFLDRLILYTAGAGNGFREDKETGEPKKLTGSNGANQILREKYQASSKMQKAAKDLAEGLGIKDAFKITRGNNEQSAQAYSTFLAALENYENHPYLKDYIEL